MTSSVNDMSFSEKAGRILNDDNPCLDHYGTIDESHHSNATKRTSVTVPVMGHQPCHQLEVSRRSSSVSYQSHATTESEVNRRDLFYDEMAAMIKLAIPVTLTYILEMMPGIITIVLVGRVKENESEEEVSLQKLHIDAAALAVMFMNVVALSPGFGILTALDTLCSQAHGANQSSKMGTYSLTGLVIITIICTISSAILWNATSILVRFGQPLAVADHAGVFARYLIPGIPFGFAYELIRKVSQSRNEAMPMLISVIICNIVTISSGYYLVHCTAWGWLGAAIARAAGEVVLVPTILIAMIMGWGGEEGRDRTEVTDVERLGLIQTKFDKNEDTNVGNIVGNDREFLHQLMDGFLFSDALRPAAIIEFLSLGFPGMLQLMFEWCAFEVIALLCGILGGDKAIIGIGANAVIMNFSSMTYMLYLGVSVSGNVRIGNALGAGDSARAKSASYVTLGLGAFMSMINVMFLLVFRQKLPWLITTDIDIVEEAQRLFIVAAIFQFPDAIGASVQGIFRGSGRQALAAKLNFAAYYIIGIPLGYLLGIKLFHLGVIGLWIGMTVGLCVICFFGTFLVLQSDWIALINEASARLSRSNSVNNF